jgi:hypothetical protein
MPADIVAGDWLVVSGDGYNLHVAEHPSGWIAINASRNIHVKIADGSEAGATIDWVSTDTTSLDPFATSPNPRAAVFAAFSYRFPVQPISGGGFGPNSACHPFVRRVVPPGGSPDFLTPTDDSDYYGTPFGGFVNTVYQFRFLGVSAEAGASPTGPHLVADSIMWFGDLIQDRTDIQSQDWSGDPDSYEDPVSWSWADQFYLTDTANNDPGTHVTVAGGAGVGFDMEGFSLLFPAPPIAYWGINATTPT